MFKIKQLLCIVLVAGSVLQAAFSAPAAEKHAKVPTDTVKTEQSGNRVENITTVLQHIPFANLEWVDETGGLSLSGTVPRRDVRFTIKRDEIVTKSELKLFYTPSPSLIPVRSQLNVYLNGVLQKSIPIKKEDLGKKVSEVIEFDSHIIRDQNQIHFDFIGHYTDYCENPVDSTIWLNISSQSILDLSKQHLHIANDLSSFPIPFFNVSNQQKSVLSVIFADTPDNNTLKAASVFASYGGVLTSWSGVDYPVFINELPASGNLVVFITNDKKPDFLKDYPNVQVPCIEMADVPGTQADKMLIISAPDTQGLVDASRALTQGNVLFNGPLSMVLELLETQKRKPYDAPKWIDTSKKVTFGSLTFYDKQLSSQGFSPSPIEVELNLPPDLYFVNGSRVDVNLIYKYTKPMNIGLSQMRFIINDHLIRSYPLKPESETSHITENIPLLGGLSLFNKSKIDSSFLRPQNTLTFDFKYSMIFSSKVNECTTQLPIDNQVEIDPNSTIDFTDFYHFTKMPNLEIFWTSGYPFSIYADLQETAAIVNDPGDTSELNALFNTLARIGSQLGFPALNVEVLGNPSEDEIKKYSDCDLLVFGQVPSILSEDDNANVVLDATQQSINTSFNDSVPTHFNDEKKEVTMKIKQKNATGVGAFVSFMSPLNSNKTVVALISDSSEGMENIARNMIVNHGSSQTLGSVTVIKGDTSKSFDVGETYYIGDLPWYQRIYYILLDNPWFLMFLCLFCAVVFCILMYRFLRHIQKSRLKMQQLRKEQ